MFRINVALITLLLFLLLTSTSVLAQKDFNGFVTGQHTVTPTGGLTYDVDILEAPGIEGVQPNLSLHYDMHDGPGQIGTGWSLKGMSSIYRCGKTIADDNEAHAVDFTINDALCMDKVRLVNVQSVDGLCGSDDEFRTKIDSFQRVCARGKSPAGYTYFEVYSSSGHIRTYGGDDATTQSIEELAPEFTGLSSGSTAIAWHISNEQDTNGN